jgi:SAM-dependent methyltransferase
MLIPPVKVRRCGKTFRDDKNYETLSLKEAERVLKYSPKSILDIGCSSGRLPIALKELSYDGSYKGMDADFKAIQWAKSNLENDQYKFEYFDGHNARFNPNGKIYPYEFNLEKQAFDFVYMYAVFPHMLMDDILSWTIQVHETLKSRGYFFTTVYTEKETPNKKVIDINPEFYPKGYKKEKSTLHHVVYKQRVLEFLFRAIGFSICEVTEEWNSQKGYLLRKVK